jgi:hypothetical protein
MINDVGAARMRKRNEDETMFLNVGLDIRSMAPLEPLVAAFGKRVCVLYGGEEGNGQGAHLELARSYGRDADALIRSLTKLVAKLPRTVRLKPETLEAVARVGGHVVVTVYGACGSAGPVVAYGQRDAICATRASAGRNPVRLRHGHEH